MNNTSAKSRKDGVLIKLYTHLNDKIRNLDYVLFELFMILCSSCILLIASTVFISYESKSIESIILILSILVSISVLIFLLVTSYPIYTIMVSHSIKLSQSIKEWDVSKKPNPNIFRYIEFLRKDLIDINCRYGIERHATSAYKLDVNTKIDIIFSSWLYLLSNPSHRRDIINVDSNEFKILLIKWNDDIRELTLMSIKKNYQLSNNNYTLYEYYCNIINELKLKYEVDSYYQNIPLNSIRMMEGESHKHSQKVEKAYQLFLYIIGGASGVILTLMISLFG